MSDFQSNYPGNSSIGRVVPDVPALQRIALSGLVWVIANWILGTVTFALAITSQKDSISRIVLGGVSLIWLFTYIGIAISASIWVYRAHKAICNLREVVPRISSISLAVLAFLSVALLGFPIGYSMDFLVIRAGSPDKPTMKWYSPWSKSGQVNVIVTLAAVPGAVAIYAQTPFTDREVNATFSFLAILAINFACIQGACLVFQINRRIANLVDSNTRRDFPNSPPPVRDIHSEAATKSCDTGA